MRVKDTQMHSRSPLLSPVGTHFPQVSVICHCFPCSPYFSSPHCSLLKSGPVLLPSSLCPPSFLACLPGPTPEGAALCSLAGCSSMLCSCRLPDNLFPGSCCPRLPSSSQAAFHFYNPEATSQLSCLKPAQQGRLQPLRLMGLDHSSSCPH